MRRVTLTLLVLTLYVSAGAPAEAGQSTPRITRIEFSPVPDEEGGGIMISLLGSGQCAYTIDYGDGKTERRTATLPDRMRHEYAPDKQYPGRRDS